MASTVTVSEIEPIYWQGFLVPVYLATTSDGKVLCGPVVFAVMMPSELTARFRRWQKHRLLSITMPPALPWGGQAYYLDDVMAAIEDSGVGAD